MPVWTAFTSLAGRDAAAALEDALAALEPTGTGVFEIEDGSGRFEVAGYFAAPPDVAGLALLALVHGARDFAVSEVPDTDWVAKVRRDLTPVVAGRFFVHGGHDADRVPAGAVPLLIEAAMAFGTGHHGTTQGCLMALDRLAGDGLRADRVADVGCGTAVLAMAAAHLWPGAAILAADIDPLAVEVAEANLAANGLAGRIRCLETAGFDHPDLAAGGFDVICANILKAPLIAMAGDMAAANRGGGVAILSGLLSRQAAEVLKHYRDAGYSLLHRQEIVDWTTLTLRRSG